MKTALPILLLMPMMAAAVAAQQEGVSDKENLCIVCHGNSDLWEADTRRLFVAPDHLAGDIHSQKGIKCQGCHGGNPDTTNLREAHAVEDGFRQIVTPSDIPGFCGHCHSDVEYMRQFQKEPSVNQVTDFWASVHGRHLQANPDAKNAAACNACHPKHAIRQAQDPQ